MFIANPDANAQRWLGQKVSCATIDQARVTSSLCGHIFTPDFLQKTKGFKVKHAGRSVWVQTSSGCIHGKQKSESGAMDEHESCYRVSLPILTLRISGSLYFNVEIH